MRLFTVFAFRKKCGRNCKLVNLSEKIFSVLKQNMGLRLVVDCMFSVQFS